MQQTHSSVPIDFPIQLMYYRPRNRRDTSTPNNRYSKILYSTNLHPRKDQFSMSIALMHSNCLAVISHSLQISAFATQHSIPFQSVKWRLCLHQKQSLENM